MFVRKSSSKKSEMLWGGIHVLRVNSARSQKLHPREHLIQNNSELRMIGAKHRGRSVPEKNEMSAWNEDVSDWESWEQ